MVHVGISSDVKLPCPITTLTSRLVHVSGKSILTFVLQYTYLCMVHCIGTCTCCIYLVN